MDEAAPVPVSALAKRRNFALGGVTIRPSTRSIEGPDGTAIIEPRVMQVLLALLDARGEVLSREALLEQCWSGTIVGDDAINRTIAEIRRALRESGSTISVETIPRIGYRIEQDQSAKRSVREFLGFEGFNLGRRQVVAGSLATVTALAAGGTVFSSWQRASQVDRLIEQGKIARASAGPNARAQAEAIFRSAIEIDPKRADAWGWLARVVPDSDAAREIAIHTLELDQSEPNARVVLITQRRDLVDWADWEDALLEVLAEAPDNTLALDFLTLFYQGMGRCKDSWVTNERLIASEPFDTTALHRRAFKHWIFGRPGEADKVADQTLQLRPRDPYSWNARLIIYAFTDRAPAAVALLDDIASRPANLTAASIEFWRSALRAIESRSSTDIAKAVEVCTAAAILAPGLAANAIMIFSYLGLLDHAYRVADGLFEGRGAIVQQSRGQGIGDIYSGADWGRTQFLFIPVTAAFRDDERFFSLCERMGHVAYWRKRGIWPDPFVRGSLKPS